MHEGHAYDSWYGYCVIFLWYMLDGCLSEHHSHVWYNYDMVHIAHTLELLVLG
jgi:hypothetical protein